MRMTMRAALAVAVVPGLFLLGGCGGAGSEVVGGFAQLVIGPGGGDAEAQNVRLVVPPGAFAEDHVVAILEQPTPLPIEEQEDGAIVVYHDNIMCIGPLDLVLAVPGYLRMCYPDSGYPKGLGESDLVLLEWNEALGVMQIAEDAVQNSKTNCFEDLSYDRLGHVAIGVRFPPTDPVEFDFAFWGSDDSVSTAGDVATTEGLVLVDLDGDLETALVPGTDVAWDYLGNGPGTRMLYGRFEGSEQVSLHTFDLDTFTDREIAAANTFSQFHPLFGWFGYTDEVYLDAFNQVQSAGTQSFRTFTRVSGDASVTTPLYAYDGNLFLDDVRISPDGTMAILRFSFFDGKGSSQRVDVIDFLGNVLAADLDVDLVDFTRPTPRWTPDSSAITFLAADAVTVMRVDPDGTDEATLYTLPAGRGTLLDFAVAPTFAPDAQRGAMVRRVGGVILLGGANDEPGDYFSTDALAGGDFRSQFLSSSAVPLVDLVPLYSENWQTPLVAVQRQPSFIIIDGDFSGNLETTGNPFFSPTMFFDLATAALWRTVPAGLSDIDFTRQGDPGTWTASALVAIYSTDTETFPEYPTPGIYHLDPTLTTVTNVTPPGWEVGGPPRWTQSWRRAPGTNFSSPVR